MLHVFRFFRSPDLCPCSSVWLRLAPSGSVRLHFHCKCRHASYCYVVASNKWRDQIVTNYLTLWSTADFSLLDIVASPNITVYQDRIPSGNGSASYPITNSTAFRDFIEVARVGFSSYQFVNMLNFGEDDLVAVRWQLQGVATGENG